jgi:hypothetical protein
VGEPSKTVGEPSKAGQHFVSEFLNDFISQETKRPLPILNPTEAPGHFVWGANVGAENPIKLVSY